MAVMPEMYVNVAVNNDSSEGLAELIERLAVAAFKWCDTEARIEALAKRTGPETAALIAELMRHNAQLWRIKDWQADAVAREDPDAAGLRVLIKRDIELCKSRALIRAELNRRLGQAPVGESVKQYGG